MQLRRTNNLVSVSVDLCFYECQFSFCHFKMLRQCKCSYVILDSIAHHSYTHIPWHSVCVYQLQLLKYYRQLFNFSAYIYIPWTDKSAHESLQVFQVAESVSLFHPNGDRLLAAYVKNMKLQFTCDCGEILLYWSAYTTCKCLKSCNKILM